MSAEHQEACSIQDDVLNVKIYIFALHFHYKCIIQNLAVLRFHFQQGHHQSFVISGYFFLCAS